MHYNKWSVWGFGQISGKSWIPIFRDSPKNFFFQEYGTSPSIWTRDSPCRPLVIIVRVRGVVRNFWRQKFLIFVYWRNHCKKLSPRLIIFFSENEKSQMPAGWFSSLSRKKLHFDQVTFSVSDCPAQWDTPDIFLDCFFRANWWWPYTCNFLYGLAFFPVFF